MTEKTVHLRARPTMLRAAEHYIVTWYHTVPPETPFDEMLKPDFWAHVAAKLRPHHRIVVDCEDGSWTATLFVRSAQRLSAVMGVLSKTDFKGAIEHAPAAMQASDYDVAWGGPAHKHRVVRKSDKSVVKHGFDTPEQAQQWVKNHIMAA